ncbi:MAG TPA: DUF433 domain-containing protein [Gracilimonas sp.]|uniref:DUF433 domain-containing protein n=1 Tax=Gracilimonas sp. TaxID=1974203 RepID=UPI002D9FC210|nr:DUF433 domain-containing protein [Gracilimonas sp.]
MRELTKRIIIDEGICNGKPVIRETRITVQSILEYLSAGDSVEDVLEAYPSLSKEDVLECIRFAANLMNRKFTIDPTAA